MTSVREDVQEILVACGYAIDAGSTPHLIMASRDTEGGRETMRVLVPDISDSARARGEILEGLAASAAAGDARRLVLLPKQTSLGAPFQAQVREAGGRIRSYAFFYDTPFRSGGEDEEGGLGAGQDGGGDAAEYAREQVNYDLLDRDTLEAIARKSTLTRIERARGTRAGAQADDRPRVRAPQPYFKRDGLASPSQAVPDADLLRHLTLLFTQEAVGPEVTLVIGSAGAGKSVAFSALYTYLYETFMKRKEAQAEGARPIPVLPESLLAAQAYSTDALFKAVAETEVAAALDPRLLDKYVRDGRAVLMIDGLDEFFADQDDFFPEIERRYLVDGSRARIVIALRDSLLSSSPNVARLVESFGQHAGCTLRIFQLAAWEDPEAKRSLAWLRLAGRLPLPGEQDTGEVAEFMSQLAARPIMSRLARLPFWCNELIKDFEAGRRPPDGAGGPDGAAAAEAGLPHDEYELLDRALMRLIEREWNKHRHSKDGAVVPEAAFVPGMKGAALAFERMILGWQTWGPTAAFDSLITGVPRDPNDGPTVREVLEAKYAADGHAVLLDLLEEAAWRYRRLSGSAQGDGSRSLNRDVIAGLYEKRRSWALGRAERQNGERILRHFALFAQGERGGVDFAHDYMADYLAARYALRRIADKPASFCEVLGAPALGETEVFTGFLKKELADKPAVVTAILLAIGKQEPGPVCTDYARQLLGREAQITA